VNTKYYVKCNKCQQRGSSLEYLILKCPNCGSHDMILTGKEEVE